jgi:hypothetical protein
MVRTRRITAAGDAFSGAHHDEDTAELHVPSLQRVARCDGCGYDFGVREVTELHDGNHDGLTFFDGDILCRRCCGAAGIEY